MSFGTQRPFGSIAANLGKPAAAQPSLFANGFGSNVPSGPSGGTSDTARNVLTKFGYAQALPAAAAPLVQPIGFGKPSLFESILPKPYSGSGPAYARPVVPIPGAPGSLRPIEDAGLQGQINKVVDESNSNPLNKPRYGAQMWPGAIVDDPNLMWQDANGGVYSPAQLRNKFNIVDSGNYSYGFADAGTGEMLYLQPVGYQNR